MISSLSMGPRTLLNDCNHSATTIFWRSAITRTHCTSREQCSDSKHRRNNDVLFIPGEWGADA